MISMRSTSLRSSVGTAGLNAPPQGTPSTTSRKASNSCSPHNDGTPPAGPVSPPGGASTPATVASAVRRSEAPRRRRSSPRMTVSEAGTRSIASDTRVAVIWTSDKGTTATLAPFVGQPITGSRFRHAGIAIDDDRVTEPCAAVHDTVSNGIEGGHLAQRRTHLLRPVIARAPLLLPGLNRRAIASLE